MNLYLNEIQSAIKILKAYNLFKLCHEKKNWVIKKSEGLIISLFLEPLDSSKFVSTNLGAVLARRRGGLRDRLLERVRRGGLRDLLRVGIMGGGLLREDADRSLSRLRSRILPEC